MPGKSEWVKKNWVSVILALFGTISIFFGSVSGFIEIVLQTLDLHPTLFQFLSFVLVIVGVLLLGSALTLAKREPDKQVLTNLAPFYRLDKFDATVERQVYEIGQSIFFEASFSGLLRAGYFDTVLVAPNGVFHYVWDPQTLLSTKHLQGGELHGEIQGYDARWSTPILDTAPLGEYTAHIGIYDCLPMSDWFTEARVRFWLNWAIRKLLKKNVRVLATPRRPCIAEKTVRFFVVKRLQDGQT